MKLDAIPFYKIAEGKKKIELRLFDEKRRKISAGDSLIFRNTENFDVIIAAVKALHTFPDFTELYKTLPLTLCGYEEGEEVEPSDMERYYTKEDINKYGAVGIIQKFIQKIIGRKGRNFIRLSIKKAFFKVALFD